MLQSRRKKILDLYARACNVTEGKSFILPSLVIKKRFLSILWGHFHFFPGEDKLFTDSVIKCCVCFEVRHGIDCHFQENGLIKWNFGGEKSLPRSTDTFFTSRT